jgi:hypothetical protein
MTEDIRQIVKRWTTGRLRIETADLLKMPRYFLMTNDQKRKQDLPVTDEDMREFIIKKAEAEADEQ